MRFIRVAILVALCALLLFGVPTFADNWIDFSPLPGNSYFVHTTSFGGGDGSLIFTNALGPFTYSNAESQNSVPNSWPSWNAPPFSESATLNVLWNQGFSYLAIFVSGSFNSIGFELQPNISQVELISVDFNSSTGSFLTITQNLDGSGGALLFAAQDNTPGAYITSVAIYDWALDDFATAQWRAGNSPVTTPEPGTLLMLGSGLIGVLGIFRRKVNF